MFSKVLIVNRIEGIKTTIPFHLKVLNNGDFQKGEYSTKFIEEKLMKG